MCFHGIDRVVDDVEEDLHQLIAVAPHSRQHGFELQFDSGFRRTQIERAKLHRVGDDGIDVQEGALWGNLASEAEQVAHQSFGAASLVADLGGGRAGLVGQLGIVSEQIGVTQNRGQWIIDFVSGTSSEAVPLAV